MENSQRLYDICRLCAIESELGMDIYSAQGESRSLEQKIITCLRIDVARNDPLPKNVCATCNALLEEFHQFCCRAANAQLTLSFLLDLQQNSSNYAESVKHEAIKNELLEDGGVRSNSTASANDENFMDMIAFPPEDSSMVTTPEPEKESQAQQGVELNLPLMTCQEARDDGNPEPETARTPVEGTQEEDVEIIEDKGPRDWGIACPSCRNVFSTRSSFEVHCTEVHREAPLYSCSRCEKQLENFNSYRSHFYRHSQKFACLYCEKVFTLEGTLKTHVLAMHVPLRPFVCECCGKGYVTQSRLDKHKKQHEQKCSELKCPECHKILQTKGGLSAHLAAHKSGRCFQCDECGKTFTQKINLKKHALCHSGQRPFSCDQCDKKFSNAFHLKRHMSFHSDERPFQCIVCLKKFKTEICVKMHSKTHEKTKPYTCSDCGKGFINLAKLKQHFNVHTKETIACKHCNRTFSNSPNLLKHIRFNHKEEQKIFKKEEQSCNRLQLLTENENSLPLLDSPSLGLFSNLFDLPVIKVKEAGLLFNTTESGQSPAISEIHLSADELSTFAILPTDFSPMLDDIKL